MRKWAGINPLYPYPLEIDLEVLICSLFVWIELNWIILDEMCLIRYLRARDWDIAKSKRMIVDSFVWRKEMNPEQITPDDVRGVLVRRDLLGIAIQYRSLSNALIPLGTGIYVPPWI